MNRIEKTRLSYTDEQGRNRERILSAAAGRVTVGRSHRSDLVLSWDPRVSRLHVVIEWTGTHWAVIDDGLSRNGTFVNGNRLTGLRPTRLTPFPPPSHSAASRTGTQAPCASCARHSPSNRHSPRKRDPAAAT
ncbi:FHA domain-containing protein [Rhodococcus opacus]